MALAGGTQPELTLDPTPTPEREGVSISVPGKPRPWQRARFNHRTKQFYTAREDCMTRDGIARTWVLETGRQHFGQAPLELRVEAIFERPSSHFGTGRNSCLVKSSAPRFPGKNLGDLDNVVKGVKDALTGIAYNDDCQIVRSVESKRWATAGERAQLRVELVPV